MIRNHPRAGSGASKRRNARNELDIVKKNYRGWSKKELLALARGHIKEGQEEESEAGIGNEGRAPKWYYLSSAASHYGLASRAYAGLGDIRNAAKYSHKSGKLYSESSKLSGREEGHYDMGPTKMRVAGGYRGQLAEKKVLARQGPFMKLVHRVLGGALLLSGAFFVNGGITGNVVGNLNGTASSSIGVALFLCGLVYLFFVFREK